VIEQLDPRYDWEISYATSIELTNTKRMLEQSQATILKLQAKIRRQRESIKGQEKLWLQTKVSLQNQLIAAQKKLLEDQTETSIRKLDNDALSKSLEATLRGITDPNQ
jgi:hypothetical protein